MRRLFFLIPCLLFSFETKPWFPEFLEMHVLPEYQYRHYPSINGAREKNHSSRDHIAKLGFGMTFLPEWHGEIEGELADTSRRELGFRSTGAQVRYLLLDDTGGDPVSLAIGGNGRWTKRRYLQDPSTPYSANFDLELLASVGKEFTNTYNWLYRLWGYLGAGIGNRGAPWARPYVAFEGSMCGRNTYRLFLDGYFGFGNRSFVDTQNFNGYAKVNHQSLDMGFSYTRIFKLYGSLTISFAYRPYAHNYPRDASTFTASYDFPFSPF